VVKSKIAWLGVFCFAAFIFLMAVCVWVLTEQFKVLDGFSLFGMTGCLLFCLYFLLTEFRKRADVIVLSEYQIEKRRYYGIGNREKFDLNEVDGFTEMDYYSKKYLHLIQNGKRVACCSNFHMRNYDEVKNAMRDKLLFFGQEPYSLKAEVAYLLKL
tara:strand:- start:82 stop:552 length:471 start_codon:yes stop_codon:yes gene_type:complete